MLVVMNGRLAVTRMQISIEWFRSFYIFFMKKNLFLVAVTSALLTSCYCDKTFIGNVKPHDELVHIASSHNGHVISGAIVTKNNVSQFVGDTKDYVIVNKRTFGDLLVSGLTVGIYTPTTTKYYVKKDNPNVVVEKKKPMSKAYKGYLK